MSIRQWTEDDEKLLRTLVASRPKLTASEIGKYMGRSRGSVIGYCYRIGLALPKAVPQVKQTYRLPNNAMVKRRMRPPLPTNHHTRKKRQGNKVVAIGFADLAAHQCRFPIADDQPGPLMACCGSAVVEPFTTTGMRGSYCADCMKMITK